MRTKLLVLGLALSGCSKEPPSLLSDLGTSNAGVQQLFEARCSGASCHIGAASPAEGLELTAGVALINLVNVPAVQDAQRMRVKPGQPDVSYLLCKVDPACSPILGARMPLGVPLTAAEIKLIRDFILSNPQGGSGPDGGAVTDAGVPQSDVTPPTFAGATAAQSAPNAITVRWNAATDDTSLASSLTYLLYQASSPAGQSYAAPSFTTPPGATSFSVGKLATNTSYYFVVRARDEAGNIDTNKVEVSAKTPANSDTMPPTFAGLATATAAGTDVTLSWSAGSDNVSLPADLVYLVYQATSAAGENFTAPTYTTVPGATSYKVTGLLPNTTYYFVVRAQDTAGNIATSTVEKSAKTLSVSLATQVQPIFTAKCASAACHSGARPAQGLSLSSAATSFAALVNVSSTECAANKLVAPTLPDQSYLVWKLQGTGPCFLGSQMPKGQPLAAADIATVRSWILAGAPNN